MKILLYSVFTPRSTTTAYISCDVPTVVHAEQFSFIQPLLKINSYARWQYGNYDFQPRTWNTNFSPDQFRAYRNAVNEANRKFGRDALVIHPQAFDTFGRTYETWSSLHVLDPKVDLTYFKSRLSHWDNYFRYERYEYKIKISSLPVFDFEKSLANFWQDYELSNGYKWLVNFTAKYDVVYQTAINVYRSTYGEDIFKIGKCSQNSRSGKGLYVRKGLSGPFTDFWEIFHALEKHPRYAYLYPKSLAY